MSRNESMPRRQRLRISLSRQILYLSLILAVIVSLATTAVFVFYLANYLSPLWRLLIKAATLMLIAAALLRLAYSERSRGYIRVWMRRHIFETKYDYRSEWLRLTHSLSTKDAELSLGERSIKALASLVGSQAGALWLIDDNGILRCEIGWNQDCTTKVSSLGDPGIVFLNSTRWVVDLNQEAPGGKDNDIDWSTTPFDRDSVIVPLQHMENLCGFISVRLEEPIEGFDFEDHDMLKTAGRQIASFLMQERSATKLLEHVQFETVNRVSAYIMHDLANLTAQQSLIVQNAKKHRHNLDFVDDAFATIALSVARMESLIGQLKGSSHPSISTYESVNKILADVVRHAQSRQPQATFTPLDPDVHILVFRRTMVSVLGHLVRNAQDACDASGQVRLSCRMSGDSVEIVVNDDGCGMDARFIKEHLFKPFSTTKGDQGMGVGVYQAREYIWSLGGEIKYASAPGNGTDVMVRLPMAMNRNSSQQN